jgi:membrane associated rhomboid family serine protease
VVIPIYDRNPVRRPTVVIFGLIAANILVFLASPTAFDGAQQNDRQKGAESAYLYHYGAIPKDLLAGHNVWTLLTATFVHAGWIHLLGNMLFLFIFGNNIEDEFGRLHFLLFYFAAGLASTLAYAVANPQSTGPLVGGSGAIAAVLGAYVYLFPFARVTLLVPFLWFLPLRVPAWLVLGFWFVLQLPEFQHSVGVASSSDVAYFAHISGFILGLIYAALVVGRDDAGTGRPAPPPPRRRWAVPPPAPDYRAADPNDPYGMRGA